MMTFLLYVQYFSGTENNLKASKCELLLTVF